MPWKECHVMDERMRFVARLLEGDTMSAVCEEFGISRKTGYKIYERYKDVGVRGLTDRSRRPHHHANRLPRAVEALIVRPKKEYPAWGAPKLRERLRQRWPDIACSAISTVHAVLDGYPLTITDFSSRYLLAMAPHQQWHLSADPLGGCLGLAQHDHASVIFRHGRCFFRPSARNIPRLQRTRRSNVAQVLSHDSSGQCPGRHRPPVLARLPQVSMIVDHAHGSCTISMPFNIPMPQANETSPAFCGVNSIATAWLKGSACLMP